MSLKINKLEDKIKEIESKNSEESTYKEADKRVEESKNVSKTEQDHEEEVSTEVKRQFCFQIWCISTQNCVKER